MVIQAAVDEGSSGDQRSSSQSGAEEEGGFDLLKMFRGTSVEKMSEGGEDDEKFFPLKEDAPLVLVVGATGGVGRVVVRKLVKRGGREGVGRGGVDSDGVGYLVRVFVRDIHSETLDLIGTGWRLNKGRLCVNMVQMSRTVLVICWMLQRLERLSLVLIRLRRKFENRHRQSLGYILRESLGR